MDCTTVPDDRTEAFGAGAKKKSVGEGGTKIGVRIVYPQRQRFARQMFAEVHISCVTSRGFQIGKT